MIVHSILLTIALFVASPTKVHAQMEDEILQNINIICGDTFCEGEYDYRFNTLIIDENTALLYYEQIEYTWVKDKDGNYDKNIVKSKKAICPLNLIPEDNTKSLTEETMKQLSNCFINPTLIKELPKQ